mmetsp:Transcript_12421/g.43097  ORF Transcript_12421/g.43097 Transcript_12421/m.43097 type:complete len:209 (+) Transcript_12421:485-1111(+)
MSSKSLTRGLRNRGAVFQITRASSSSAERGRCGERRAASTSLVAMRWDTRTASGPCGTAADFHSNGFFSGCHWVPLNRSRPSYASTVLTSSRPALSTFVVSTLQVDASAGSAPSASGVTPSTWFSTTTGGLDAARARTAAASPPPPHRRLPSASAVKASGTGCSFESKPLDSTAPPAVEEKRMSIWKPMHTPCTANGRPARLSSTAQP